MKRKRVRLDDEPATEAPVKRQRVKLDDEPKPVAGVARGDQCVFCKHTYMRPCHGQDKNCPNLMYLEGRTPEPEPEPAKSKRKRVRL